MAKSKDLNDAIRDLFQRTITDGYKKNHVCALTLGSQCVPQFDGFLKGRDFGIKPMERVLGAFDYEIHVVAIPQTLISSLDNESLKQTSGRTSPLFKEAGDEILKSIGIEPEK
jgi:hypothetical protein